MARVPRPPGTAALVGGSAVGVAAGAKAWRTTASAVRFARMGGSSIAAPDAAGWITDFLNAAYFRRRPELRALEDLRLAIAVLTTRWHRGGHRRLRGPDVLAFHRAFGRLRISTGRTPRGTLDREQLLEGAAGMHGAWFPAAYADDARRGWGIAFETAAERAAYVPEMRLAHASLGPLTPPVAAPERQVWHTYPAVPVPPGQAVARLLGQPERWPDFASELGRFTPLRTGGLAGQTFEIEVAAGTEAGLPIYTRGYVTATAVHDGADPDALAAHVDEVASGLAASAAEGHPALPSGAEPVLALDLTTHEGHFIGAARSRILLFESEGGTFLRDVGVWDPMPWHVAQAYGRGGRTAQEAFWGNTEDPRKSMLHQIALAAR